MLVVYKTTISLTDNGINVLSLFDGMACGMLAFQKAGKDVKNYYAYEIDKYAIKTVQHNFPDIKELGDVFNADFTQYEGIDYLIGGSPCTYWSIAQSPDKRETTASGIGWELFSQYVRALKEAKPKYFIYENNKSMAKAIYQSISETFGFEPIMINSALVSAQNRQRYYWVGIRQEDGTYKKANIELPEDRGILLKDIIEGNDLTSNEKSYALTASYDGAVPWNTIERSQRSMVVEGVEPISTTADGKAKCLRATCYKDTVRNIVGNDVDLKTGVAEPVNTDQADKAHTVKAQYYKNSTANFVTNGGFDASAVAEPCYMRYERSEEVKKLRKDYEAHKIHHGYHEFSELQPRQDGKTNTLSTVSKDNPICEPVDSPNQVGALPRPNGELSTSQAFRIYDTDAKSVGLKAGGGGAGGKTGLYAVPVSPQKDETSKTVLKGIDKVADKVGYVPEMFNAYNGTEITDKSPTLTTGSMETSSCAVNKFEPIGKDKYEFQDLKIRDNAHIAINNNAVRGVQDKNNASCAENFYEFTDTKANTLTTAHRPKIIDEFSHYYGYAIACEWDDNNNPIKAISRADGKTYTVYAVKDGQIEIKGKIYPIKLKDGYYIIRKLTVRECMRLQTVPEWYDFSCVSNSQAYKQLGNGWTVDVIVHIINSIE